MGSILGILILAFISTWLLGGVLLRFFGMLLLILAGLGLAFTGDIVAGLLILIPGAIMWLAGHWHYAYRWHDYASPLAQRVFQQLLPARLDPTRNWAHPVHVIQPEPPLPRRRRLRERMRPDHSEQRR